jgi:hypothetical protein
MIDVQASLATQQQCTVLPDVIRKVEAEEPDPEKLKQFSRQ